MSSVPTAAHPTTTAAPRDARDARTVRADNLTIAAEQKMPLVPITGNTFPIKRLLWVFGGTYDPKHQLWSVPAHKAVEAQTIANRFQDRSQAIQPQGPAAAVPAAMIPATSTAPVPPHRVNLSVVTPSESDRNRLLQTQVDGLRVAVRFLQAELTRLTPS